MSYHNNKNWLWFLTKSLKLSTSKWSPFQLWEFTYIHCTMYVCTQYTYTVYMYAEQIVRAWNYQRNCNWQKWITVIVFKSQAPFSNQLFHCKYRYITKADNVCKIIKNNCTIDYCISNNFQCLHVSAYKMLQYEDRK